MHHSQEATDTALDWCIELISQSNVLEVDAKYAILDALKDKISSGEFSPTTRVSTRGRRAFAPVSRIAPRSASSRSPFPVTPLTASLQIRMYVESISRLTASDESGPFMRLRPENVNEVFQSLVKMGDVAHALGDDSIPMPTITLTAQTYAETMLTHLRPPYRDVENFAESVDAYDLDDDDFRGASPWLDVDALENIRVDLKKQAARVTDDTRCDGILRRWNTAKDTLVELAKYCGEILEAMGPSFLERVAADFRSGRYAPPSADGVLIPEDALEESEDDARAKRRERELLEAGRVLREAFDKDRSVGGASPSDLKNKRKAAPPATRRDDDVEAAAVRRNVTAFEKLKAANAEVADPLKEALRASDAAGGRGGGKDGGKKAEEDTWNALAAEYEADAGGDAEEEGSDESDESDESPAARAAKARRAELDGRKKIPIIRPHHRGATARTVDWEPSPPGGGNVSDVSTPPTTKKANGPGANVIGARTTRVGTSGRKAYTRWTGAQEEELRRLVGVYGVGSWATILDAGRDMFGADRTSVNLKDKWRVLTKAR